MYSVPKNQIHSVLNDLNDNPGVKYEAAYFPEVILELWPRHTRDFGDAILAAAARILSAKIATFDQKFSNEIQKLNLQTLAI